MPGLVYSWGWGYYGQVRQRRALRLLSLISGVASRVRLCSSVAASSCPAMKQPLWIAQRRSISGRLRRARCTRQRSRARPVSACTAPIRERAVRDGSAVLAYFMRFFAWQKRACYSRGEGTSSDRWEPAALRNSDHRARACARPYATWYRIEELQRASRTGYIGCGCAAWPT
jgi:hypothetical protein